MKKQIVFSLIATTLMASSAFAVKEGGGGDIQCDNTIQNLTFQDPQGNLEIWLQNDGPEKQTPKLDLSSSLNPDTGKPYTASEYEKAMIALIETFKKAPDVNCVRPGDKGYPVDVNDTSKICKTSVDANGVHMTCDRNLFMGLSPDAQIEQNHHEFAVNVPGLEQDTGSVSTYEISRQLAYSIGNVTERRLVIKSTQPQVSFSAPADDTFAYNDCKEMSDTMFQVNSATEATVFKVLSPNQTYNLVLQNWNFYLSASDTGNIKSWCQTYVDSLNVGSSSVVYSCGNVAMGPIERGCYNSGGGYGPAYYGCATASAVTVQVLQSPVLDQMAIQKLQCEKITEAELYIDRLKDQCSQGDSFFSHHVWYNKQKKFLDQLVALRHLNCN